jgi:ribosome-associated toxin RatA of RatAB toxin-antitoxin module
MEFDMASFETKHTFNGDIKSVFTALGKYERYSEFLPGVTASKVLPAPTGSKARCLVRTEINVVKTFFYTIEMFEESLGKIWWQLSDSNIMKQNNGSWVLTPDGKSRTSAVYSLDVKFKGLIPSSITDQVVKANLDATLAGFQKLIDAEK